LRKNCILEVDSPSYPPQTEEYVQCGCEMCIKHLDDIGYYEGDDCDKFERDMSNKYPIKSEEP